MFLFFMKNNILLLVFVFIYVDIVYNWICISVWFMKLVVKYKFYRYNLKIWLVKCIKFLI